MANAAQEGNGYRPDPAGERSITNGDLRDGGEDAMTAFYSQNRTRAVHRIRHAIGDYHEAEDVAQEVFLAIWTARGKLNDSEADARGLLRKATTRKIIDFYRAQGRRRSTSVGTGAQETDIFDRDTTGISGSSSFPRSPEEIVLGNRNALDLVSGLSPVQQRALLVRDGLGFTGVETAAILDTSLSAVKSAAFQGSRAIRMGSTEVKFSPPTSGNGKRA